MSVSIDLSAATKAMMLASESSEAIIFLLTVDHPNFTQPARMCSCPLERVVETDEELLYGVKSRGETYLHLPGIVIKLPTDDDASTPDITITIDPFEEIVEQLRAIGEDYPTVTVEMVLSSSPDVVEAAWPDFNLQETTIKLDAIDGTLGMEDLDGEPGVPWSFTPANFPGLF